MKKIIYVLLIALVVLVLLSVCSGCSNDITDSNDELTEEEKQEILQSYQDISVTADSILFTDDPMEGFEQMLSTYESDPAVENAWVTDGALYIEYEKGGIVSWYIAPDFIIPPYGAKDYGNKSYFNSNGKEFVGNNNACLINQQYNNENWQFCRDIVNHLSNKFTQNGYEVTIKNGEDANLDFFDSDLKDYGAIFNLSHGIYDGTNTWLMTGQEATLLDIINNYLHFWRNNRISIDCVEEKRNGEDEKISYYMISNHFIDNEYNSDDYPNSLIYLGACQSFKSTTQLAQTFHSKGVGVTIGWDETVCISQKVGELLFDALLGGADLQTAFYDLPDDAKIDDCSVNPGANLTYYPNSGGTIRLVEPTNAETVISSPVDGNSYDTRLLTLSGILFGVQYIEYGTVELNGVTTSLVTSGIAFSQPIVINSGENTIKVNCYGVLENGKSAYANKEISVIGDFPELDLFTELRWNTDYSDVDFHLLPPNSDIYDLWTDYDCYYYNMSTYWGGELDVDDVEGYGPEHITIPTVLINGTYRLFIHYYDEDGIGITDAFVNVSVRNGDMLDFGPYQLVNDGGNNAGDVWEICTIEFPSGTVTPVNQYYYLGWEKKIKNKKIKMEKK
ncbi:MAG: hypothetical protein H8D45_33150 [Bacteroidetes bacterium]|nr:hypothetical protein [Bacteroidota bacterium]